MRGNRMRWVRVSFDAAARKRLSMGRADGHGATCPNPRGWCVTRAWDDGCWGLGTNVLLRSHGGTRVACDMSPAGNDKGKARPGAQNQHEGGVPL
jgi:hypothetical protein